MTTAQLSPEANSTNSINSITPVEKSPYKDMSVYNSGTICVCPQKRKDEGIAYRCATQEEIEALLKKQEQEFRNEWIIEEKAAEPRRELTPTEKMVADVIWKIAKIKGKVPSYDTVYRRLKEADTVQQYPEVEFKPLILRLLDEIRAAYRPMGEYVIDIRCEFHCSEVQQVRLNRMVQIWTTLILKFAGYVDQRFLFRAVGGSRNVFLSDYKLLIEARWFKVVQEKVYIPSGTGLARRYNLGSRHPHYGGSEWLSWGEMPPSPWDECLKG